MRTMYHYMAEVDRRLTTCQTSRLATRVKHKHSSVADVSVCTSLHQHHVGGVYGCILVIMRVCVCVSHCSKQGKSWKCPSDWRREMRGAGQGSGAKATRWRGLMEDDGGLHQMFRGNQAVKNGIQRGDITSQRKLLPVFPASAFYSFPQK